MPQLDFTIFIGQGLIFFFQFIIFSSIYEEFFIIIISTFRLRKKIKDKYTFSFFINNSKYF